MFYFVNRINEVENTFKILEIKKNVEFHFNIHLTNIDRIFRKLIFQKNTLISFNMRNIFYLQRCFLIEAVFLNK